MHVPDGWKTYSLSEVTKEKISYGIVQAGPHIEEGMPYIKSSDVGGKIIVSSLQKTSKEIHYKYRRSSVHPGDIVFSLRGNIGEISIVPDSLPEANLTQGTARISIAVEHDRFFIYHQLSSERVLSRINKSSKGSTFKEISLEELRKVQIPLPPLHEQQKIAQILSAWDKAIEKLEALIAAKQKRKKSLMQQLLTGKKRFTGGDGEWKEIAIRQMGKIVSGGTPDTNIKEYWDGDILWMTPTDVTALKNRFISDTARKITKKGQKDSSATIIPAGSLLVCTRATIGIMSISTTDITTNQGFKNLVPNKNFDVEFLYYLFSHSKDKFIRYACGSTFFELSKKDFEKLTFKCPELQEQQKIASVLTAADTEIETHQKQLASLKQQKKGLMQQLLIGKKRVKVDSHV